MLTQLLALREHRLVGAVVTVVVAALAGLLVAANMPHGPATAPQVPHRHGARPDRRLLAAASDNAPAVGCCCWLSSYGVLAVELAQRGVAGPTVGAIRLDGTPSESSRSSWDEASTASPACCPCCSARCSACGGARAWANGLAYSLGRVATTDWRPSHCSPFAVAVALPACTPPILAASRWAGRWRAASRDRHGAHRRRREDPPKKKIRATTPPTPVLLYLAADWARAACSSPGDLRGPGEGLHHCGLGSAAAPATLRGSLDPTADLTPERAVADTIELTDYLRQRFDEDQIHLLGESYGTILGVLTVRQRLDLYHAFIAAAARWSTWPRPTADLSRPPADAEQTGDTKLAPPCAPWRAALRRHPLRQWVRDDLV